MWNSSFNPNKGSKTEINSYTRRLLKHLKPSSMVCLLHTIYIKSLADSYAWGPCCFFINLHKYSSSDKYIFNIDLGSAYQCVNRQQKRDPALRANQATFYSSHWTVNGEGMERGAEMTTVLPKEDWKSSCCALTHCRPPQTRAVLCEGMCLTKTSLQKNKHHLKIKHTEELHTWNPSRSGSAAIPGDPL